MSLFWRATRLTMQHPKKPQHHGGPSSPSYPPPGPSWKRMHHSAFFWVAACFILVGTVILILYPSLIFAPAMPAGGR